MKNLTKNLKRLSLLPLLLTVSLLCSCGPSVTVTSEIGSMPIRVVSKNSREMKTAVDNIRSNTIQVMIDSQCYNMVFIMTDGPLVVPVILGPCRSEE